MTLDMYADYGFELALCTDLADDEVDAALAHAKPDALYARHTFMGGNSPAPCDREPDTKRHYAYRRTGFR